MMQADEYHYDALIQFMRQSTIEGLLNPAVAKSRLNAVEQLSLEMTEEEKADIRKIDVNILSSRFHKLHDSSIRPEVLELYNKRVKAALADYFAWQGNPDSFFSIGGDSIRKDKRYQRSEKERSHEEKALEEITLATAAKASDIFSIPLREDRTLYIKNLPIDLSRAEADKISRVVKALVVEVTKSGDKEEVNES